MKKSTLRHSVPLSNVLGVFACLALPALADPATGWKQTGAGPYDYNDAANWVGGEINGIFGSDLTLTANQTITFAADTTLPDGLTFQYAGTYSITMESDAGADVTLTLGGDITFSPASNNDKIGVTIGSGTNGKKLLIDLGGETRSVLSVANTQSKLTLKNTISNGGLDLRNTFLFYFDSANTYAGGTTLNGSKSVYVMPDCFGTGTVTFNAGAVLNASGNRTFTINNPLVFNGDWTFSGGGGDVTLGAGPITVAQPLTITTTNSKTLSIGGPVDANSLYGIGDITKAGEGVLHTAADLTPDGDTATLVCTGGLWDFGGTVNAETLELTGAGAVRFSGAGALSAVESIVLVDGACVSPSAAYPPATLLALIDRNSSGVLAMSVNATANLDFTDYPNLFLGAATTATLQGTLTPAADGVYRIGGGPGGSLTLNSANALSGNHDAIVHGSVRITDANNISGTITVPEGATLQLQDNGALLDASVVVTRGTLMLLATTAIDVLHANDVTLQAGTIDFRGAKSKRVTHRIGTLTLLPAPGVGGTPQITDINKDSGGTQLAIGTIVRPHPIFLNLPTDDNLGSTEFTGGFNITVDNPEASDVINLGGGVEGTVTAPNVPWVRHNGQFVYYDATRGFRYFNTSTERQSYGATATLNALTTSGENLWVAQNNSAAITLTLGAGDMEASAIGFGYGSKAATLVKSEGSLKVLSGAILLDGNATSTLNVPLDFGSRRGYLMERAGKGQTLRGSIAGTNGLTIGNWSLGNSTGSNGTGVTLLTSGNTFSGDVHVFDRIAPQDVDFFPNGAERPGDTYLHGYWQIQNYDSRLNGLNGAGLIYLANGFEKTITLGCDGSDGDFTGDITRSNGTLSFVKTGAGRQRFAGNCSYNGTTTVEAGTLQIDGTNTASAVSVASGAKLAGVGSFTKAVTVADGGALEAGSAKIAYADDHTLDFGNTLTLAGNATLRVKVYGKEALATVRAADVSGSGTVTVAMDSGNYSGEFLLVKSDAALPCTFAKGANCGGLSLRNNGTELWVAHASETVVLLK